MVFKLSRQSLQDDSIDGGGLPMAVYSIGEIVRKERVALGITQEELAHNICSTSWLSKIESGVKTPTTQTFELLMHRLGKNTSQFVLYKGEKEIQNEALKHQVRASWRIKQLDAAKVAFKTFQKNSDEHNVLDQQFLLLYGTLLNRNDYTKEECLSNYQKALKISIPDFEISRLMDYMLSSDEIVIINSLGNIQSTLGQIKEAIQTFKQIIEYLDRPKFDVDEKKKIYSSVLYNLSNLIGLEGNHTECITYCDKAINYSIENNLLWVLPNVIFNKGWAYAELGNLTIALKYFTEAYYTFLGMKDDAQANKVNDLVKEHWNICFV